MRKSILLLAATSMALGLLTITGCDYGKKDKYTKDGKLIVSARNLYFSGYAGGDSYLDKIEKDFKVHFEFKTYDWSKWSQQVNTSVQGLTIDDIFHANIDSYNFANTYKDWAENEVIKPLPKDLSKWPKIQELINNTSNIDALKIDGRLYGIPIAKNTSDYSTSFSPFTYIYRRDWAKQLGVYQENDIYTWEQFTTLLDAFKEYLAPYNKYALADIEWGYPSIPNFYKQVPHCFAQDSTGKYVNNYTTDKYCEGLQEARRFKDNGWYHPDQNSAQDGEMNKKYYGNQVGVLYENLSYSNFWDLKDQLRQTNVDTPGFNIDDAMAIMKIKGTDDKYALEGTDNWFSMTFFDDRISDKKMNLILDLMNYLLDEEGTRFSVFGFENFDYKMVDGKPEIIEEAWPKDKNGEYAEKKNGARYLRYLVSLGYDTYEYDPLTDKTIVEYLNDWEDEMKTQKEAGNLKVLKETSEVMWLTTPKKSKSAGIMRSTALLDAMKFIYRTDGYATINDFKAKFDNATWRDVLAEINKALGH